MFCATCISYPNHVSFVAEVIADDSGKWVGNGLRFATPESAKSYAKDLYSRWTAVRQWRVTPSSDPVNQ
jgi:hypothetical protein